MDGRDIQLQLLGCSSCYLRLCSWYWPLVRLASGHPGNCWIFVVRATTEVWVRGGMSVLVDLETTSCFFVLDYVRFVAGAEKAMEGAVVFCRYVCRC